ncbi:hypothetical protein A5893_05965 [Pedobacter psychrophilus]|uniref:Auto-transporter adhesin head GIN domain-containing protein n=1 Tax=Pedobacter psychrophilus TaxID=1826909 RepID=A0A179DHI9_9SPHI|nr:hypothetical protein [Pedobacter psychrophilus]OAQ40491.1 hypothetical protein A5893_05965 [Pedobacter psychrophilus]
MKLYLFLLLFSLPIFVEAQNLEPFKIYDHKKLEENSLKVYSEKGVICLTALKPDVIKVNFSTLPEANPILKTNKSIYVRVTQNLDDIFMQTDSLLIIINKLDFSIKYKSLTEKLFFVNDNVSINDSCNVLGFKLDNNQKFSDSKGKKLRDKSYKFKNQKLILSTNNYSILFKTEDGGLLKMDNETSKLTLSTKNKLLAYYFIGDAENLENVLNLIN